MLINFPNKNKQWSSQPLSQFNGDIVRAHNLQGEEYGYLGEVRSNVSLSLVNSSNYLPTSFLDDKNNFITFADYDGIHTIDKIKGYTVSLQSPNYDIHVKDVEAINYPAGYIVPNWDTNNSSGTFSGSGINNFSTLYTRVYSYNASQKLRAVYFRFSFNLSGSSPQAIIKYVIDDGISSVEVYNTGTLTTGKDVLIFVPDGTNGVNLQNPAGITAKVLVAAASGTTVSWYAQSLRISFFSEAITTNNLIVGIGSWNVFWNRDNSYYGIFYPGTTSPSDNIYYGIYGVASLDTKYPVIMRMFRDNILLIGNRNKIHLIYANGKVGTIPDATSSTINYLNWSLGEAVENRLVLNGNYTIEWITSSNDLVYIGAKIENYYNYDCKHYVFIWRPDNDEVNIVYIEDGEGMGAVNNNYFYLITSRGNIRMLYNNRLELITKWCNVWGEDKVPIPHRNGVVSYDEKIAFLVSGSYYNSAGIYIFNTSTKNAYHYASINSSTTTNIENGGAHPEVKTGALTRLNVGGENVFYAGIANVKTDSGWQTGLYATKNVAGNQLGTNFGYFETAKIPTVGVDKVTHSLALKYRNVGEINVLEKKIETLENFTSDVYTGDWGSSVTNPSSFTITSLNPYLKVGNRIIVMDGKLRGFRTIIKSISDSSPYTITIDPPNAFENVSITVSGTFNFVVERFGYGGTWIADNKFTTDATLSVGDSIEILNGFKAGNISFVKSINGNEITLTDSFAGATGSFLFFPDKYKLVGSPITVNTISNPAETYKIIDANTEPYYSDFSQYKVVLKGDVYLNEFQVNSRTNLNIGDNY